MLYAPVTHNAFPHEGRKARSPDKEGEHILTKRCTEPWPHMRSTAPYQELPTMARSSGRALFAFAAWPTRPCLQGAAPVPSAQASRAGRRNEFARQRRLELPSVAVGLESKLGHPFGCDFWYPMLGARGNLSADKDSEPTALTESRINRNRETNTTKRQCMRKAHLA